MVKKYLIVLFFSLLLLVCGCDKKQKANTENSNKKEEIKEEIKVEENKEEQENIEKVEEGEKQEENKQNIPTNNTPTKPNIENNKPEETPKEEIKTPSIIGTWIYNNEEYVYIFEESKLIRIIKEMNMIKEHTYTIDSDKVIIDGKTVQTFEISGDKLYLGAAVLTKAPSNYKYPSIYENLDIFYGTWKLQTEDKVIMLEDGYETTLEETFTINKNNMSGFGSCGGSGCYSYIFNFLNSKPELYRGSLCYELVDNNTLSQIKCHSDNIIGWTGWEDETLHNIVYKRIG